MKAQGNYDGGVHPRVVHLDPEVARGWHNPGTLRLGDSVLTQGFWQRFPSASMEAHYLCYPLMWQISIFPDG